jgi:hypothetical protein
MPVKYWSFAGLMLTYWCNARCASCYLCCGGESEPDGEMSIEQALDTWRQLIDASPHGCRVHLSGGEPFGDWPRLIELCRQAQARGLGPLDKVETNAFWASDDAICRQRVAALAEAGMRKIAISADPYHQQFVPIERCRRLARVGEELLGAARVQVRWRDWLAEGGDTDGLSDDERRGLFLRYAAGGRDRLAGRAALLATDLPLKPPGHFSDDSCRDSLLRGRHVHIDGGGLVMPGTCAGIVLGRMGSADAVGLGPPVSVGSIWQSLSEDVTGRLILEPLVEAGPCGLLPRATAIGFVPDEGYASKCHLCWSLRRFLWAQGIGHEELGPGRLYSEVSGR